MHKIIIRMRLDNGARRTDLAIILTIIKQTFFNNFVFKKDLFRYIKISIHIFLHIVYVLISIHMCPMDVKYSLHRGIHY